MNNTLLENQIENGFVTDDMVTEILAEFEKASIDGTLKCRYSIFEDEARADEALIIRKLLSRNPITKFFARKEYKRYIAERVSG